MIRLNPIYPVLARLVAVLALAGALSLGTYAGIA
jgi:hypothetical protein